MIEWDKIAFVDTETIRLRTGKNVVWEAACIIGEEEFRWLLPVDPAKGDPISLSIGGFHDRHPLGNNYTAGDKPLAVSPRLIFANQFAQLTHNRHLIGAVPSFDEERLRNLLLSQRFMPSWHYHLIDIEAMAVGYLCGAVHWSEIAVHWSEISSVYAEVKLPTLPWSSSDLSRAVGVNPENYETHTALGDCRWVRDLYKMMMGEPS